MIRTAATHFQNLRRLVPDYEQHLAELTPMQHWARQDVPRYLPVGISSTKGLQAFVNHERWLVQCPCGGVQFAAPTDPRFFCVDCLNVKMGGKWVPVLFPKDRVEIEAILSQRPNHLTRNWRPGETVSQLRRENELNLEAVGRINSDWDKTSEQFVQEVQANR